MLAILVAELQGVLSRLYCGATCAHLGPNLLLNIRDFDLGMLEIRSDMQTVLAAGDTNRPQFIRVLEYN